MCILVGEIVNEGKNMFLVLFNVFTMLKPIHTSPTSFCIKFNLSSTVFYFNQLQLPIISLFLFDQWCNEHIDASEKTSSLNKYVPKKDKNKLSLD